MDSTRRRRGYCQEEFQCSNFFLDFHDPDAFASSQWFRPSLAYTVYRIIAALYCVIWVVIYWAYYGPKHEAKGLIYYAEWSFDLLTVSLILRAGISCYGYNKQTNKDAEIHKVPFDHMFWILKLSWVLYNTSSCAALLVTFLHWVFLFDVSLLNNSMEWSIDLQRHTLQSVLVVFDMFFTATPIRIFHVSQIWVYNIIFIIFSIIYELFPPSRPPTYSQLSWKDNPGESTGYSLLLIFLVSTSLWLILNGIFWIRLFISEIPNRQPSKDRDAEYLADLERNRNATQHNIYSGTGTNGFVINRQQNGPGNSRKKHYQGNSYYGNNYQANYYQRNPEYQENHYYHEKPKYQLNHFHGQTGGTTVPYQPYGNTHSINRPKVSSQHGVHCGPVTKVLVTK